MSVFSQKVICKLLHQTFQSVIFNDINYLKTVFFKAKSVCLLTYEPLHEISNNVVWATSKVSDKPAHTRSLIRGFASRLNIL